MVAIQCPAKLGRYILLRHLQSGGMAELYAAKISGVENFERLVAIKIVRPPGGGDAKALKRFVDMFVDEARLAGQLTHANIAQIYELGRFHQQLYIAMELVEGHNVIEVVNRLRDADKPVPHPFAAYVVSQTALGLDYAHRREDLQGRPLNLVHRDVSPHNILLSYEGEVKIIDFGVAKATSNRTETLAGMLKGKVAYMAPEQIRTRQVDRRVDIFALGCVLYEMLSGQRLYQGEDTLELLEQVRNADHPVFEEKLEQVPPELILVLRSALAPDPENRFQTAADLAKALEPFLIYNRSIYGAAEAAAVIRDAYPDTPNRRRDFVNPSDDQIRDLGREFAPSVVEAFDQAGSRPQRAMLAIGEVAFEGESGRATRPEYDEAPATGSERRTTGGRLHDPAAAPPAPPPKPPPEIDPNYVEPQDVSGIHEAFDGSPPEKRFPFAAAMGGLVLLLAVAATGYVFSGAQERLGPSTVAAAPLEKVGYVSVATKEGKRLEVLIDGKLVGSTPIERHALPYGAHTLIVQYSPAPTKPKGRKKVTGKSKNRDIPKKQTRPQSFTVGENNTMDNPVKVVINDGGFPGD